MFLSMLLTAIALVMVIEGILPFLSPTLYRQTMLKMVTCSDRSLRTIGLIGLLLGALIMFCVHSGIF